MTETTNPSPRNTRRNQILGTASAPAATRPLVMVDDDVECLAAVTELLAMFGYKVTAFAEASAALAYLRATGTLPEGILLDQRMPGMRGSEFLVERARDPRLRSIPVIITSAEDDGPQGDERWLRLGAAGRIAKPLTLDSLLGALTRALPPVSA